MPPVIAAFRAARPDVRLELIEMRSLLQVEALRMGRVEIGLACGPVEEEDVVTRVLVEEAVLVAVGRANPLAGRKSVRLRELATQALVLVRPDIEPAWAHVCGAALRRAGIDLPVMQETDSKIAMLGLVAANLGVSLVSASVRRLGREGVEFLPISDLRLRLPLVSLSLPSASPRAQEFLRLTRQCRSAFKQTG
jgi:DNA-binding transcriptional LysR family regulator